MAESKKSAARGKKTSAAKKTTSATPAAKPTPVAAAQPNDAKQHAADRAEELAQEQADKAGSGQADRPADVTHAEVVDEGAKGASPKAGKDDEVKMTDPAFKPNDEPRRDNEHTGVADVSKS